MIYLRYQVVPQLYLHDTSHKYIESRVPIRVREGHNGRASRVCVGYLNSLSSNQIVPITEDLHMPNL